MRLNIQSRVVGPNRRWPELHDTQALQPVALFAIQLIERWGMIAAAPDGEDSAGRAKMRLLASEEIVARACQTALIAFEQFAHKDWLLDLPLPLSDEERKLLERPEPNNQPNQKDQNQ